MGRQNAADERGFLALRLSRDLEVIRLKIYEAMAVFLC